MNEQKFIEDILKNWVTEKLLTQEEMFAVLKEYKEIKARGGEEEHELAG